MVKMVCLANSWRPGGRCVAGIDLETGEWIRPVPKGGSAIHEESTKFGPHELAPLDVVEVELAPPTLATKYQRENRVIMSSKWSLVDTINVSDVLKYCSTSTSVLHSHSKVVDPDTLELLAPAKWRSLELRKVDDAKFVPDPNKQNRWQIEFTVTGVLPTHLCLGVTDPISTHRLNAGGKIGQSCLLTLSLTEPVALPQFNKPTLCYKLAAAVIEL